MKRFIILVSAVTVFSMVIAACGGGAPTEAATQIPATQPGVTDPGAAPATDAPAVVPIDLAGPPMEVGSFYTYVDGAILAAVPGGPFIMGYNYFDNLEREVVVGDFWIYTNEVTNAQYGLCVALGQCTAPDKKDNPGFDNYRFVSFPVVGVDHQQAVDYCTFVHGRLPTEAEWEKAARGPEGNLFPWGNNSPECDLLNYNFCEGKAIDVKSYPGGVSYYGLFDMGGNIREWAADWYASGFNADGAIADPLGPELGQKRAIRSSSFADSADFAISAHRFSLTPLNHLPDLGFRCVIEDPTYYAPYCETTLLYGSDPNGNPTDDVIPVADTCVQPSLTYNEDCQTNSTQIKVVPYPLPAGYNVTAPSECSGGTPTYTCVGTGTVTIDPAVCDVIPPPGGGSCAPGYIPSPDPGDPNKTICTGYGLGENCMQGYTYLVDLACCTAEIPGQNAYTICNPGFYKVGNDCIPSGSNPPQPVSVHQDFNPVADCPPPGGGDSTGNCPPITCPYGQNPAPYPQCGCQ